VIRWRRTQRKGAACAKCALPPRPSPHPFLDGYCSTVQGWRDWTEVDLGFTKLLFIQTDLRVMCVFVLYAPLSLSFCLFWTSCTASPAQCHTHTHKRTHTLSHTLAHTQQVAAATEETLAEAPDADILAVAIETLRKRIVAVTATFLVKI